MGRVGRQEKQVKVIKSYKVPVISPGGVKDSIGNVGNDTVISLYVVT